MWGYLVAAAAYLLAAVLIGRFAPLRRRWPLAAGVAAIGVVVLTPGRCVSLPMVMCRRGDCELTGTRCRTLVGLATPGDDGSTFVIGLLLAGLVVATACAAAALAHSRRSRQSVP
ncbi:MAG TPA: hypothetical protein VK453_18760 [Micromonosporaceae bacterium]|nr:hypothetical protein [Micromonosporaceae bacterium]